MKGGETGYYRILCVAWIVLVAGCSGGSLSVIPELPTTSATVQEDGAAALVSDSTAPAPDCLELGEPSTETHRALFEALNNYRIANGLEPLLYSRRLEEAADAHVRDMAQRGYFAHLNPEGETPGGRAVAVGFCHDYVGENLAAGQRSVEAAQRAWENSPSHNENMLEPAYRYVGVGYYVSDTGRMFWTQEMAYDVP